jgi:hypothetical protein
MSRFSTRSVITGSAVALAGVLVVGGVAVANASNDNRPLVSSVVPTSLTTSDPTNGILDPTSTPIPEPSETAEPTPEPSETAELGDDDGLGEDEAGEDANEQEGHGDHGKGDTEEHGSVVVTPGSASTSNPDSGKHGGDND